MTLPDRHKPDAPAPPALALAQVAAGLNTRRLGRRIHYFERLDSTNTHARALAENGAAEGEIVIAELQSRGRGRLGRHWVSPSHVNLYLSVILRPTLPPSRAPQITLAAAVGIADAAARFSPVPPEIKWPNDILAGGKKLAGVLTEAVSTAQRVEFVILGIGVNVNYASESMPADLRSRATSLSILSERPVSREAFLKRLIQDLDRCYGVLEERGFPAIAARWDARFNLKGRRVRVDMPDQSVTGLALGIDADGALIIGTGDGRRERIIAGDVIPIE